MAKEASSPKTKSKSRRGMSSMPGFYGDINRRIQWIRASKNLTMEDMAHQLGITKATMQAICDGRTNPNIYVLRQMRKVFRVTYDWLIDGVGGKPEVASNKSIEQRLVQLEKMVALSPQDVS